MAKKLSPSEVDFRRTRGGDSWFNSEWLDGDPWLLVQGEDFTAKPDTVRARLYNEAAAKNLGARSKVLGDGNIVFQTYERTPEEMEKARMATEKRNATRAANSKKKAKPQPA
jgi:hypothetical protein